MMIGRNLLLAAALCFFSGSPFCIADVSAKTVQKASADADFPEEFPEELKSRDFFEKESRELAEGVRYYHYHWKNILPDDVIPLKKVWTFTVRFDPKKEGQKAAAKETIADLKKEIGSAKPGDYYKVVKGFKGVTVRRIMLQNGLQQLEPEVDAAVSQLKREGKSTDVIEQARAFCFAVYETKVTKFPVSVYFVVIDWDKAKVSLKLAQCGARLKTVKEMVEDFHPIAATNGAYFHFVPPTTYYPLKIDGTLYPAKGYDSHEGMAFNAGEMPVIAKEEDFGKYENVIMGYHIWSKGQYTLGGGKVASEWAEVAAGDTPLTAIGFNFEKRRVVLMTSDGRFPKDAPGLNFYSEGFFLRMFGCDEVLSIDGGGSCTMLIREKKKLSDPVNHPSDNRKFDHKGARSVQNCVYLIDWNK